jgi:hypothetical protein
VAREPHGLVDGERATVEVEVHSDIGLKQIRHDGPKVLGYTDVVAKLADLPSPVQIEPFASVQLD